MPTKAPVAEPQPGGFYSWIDGAYESIKMPTYGLGFRLIPAGSTDGQAASFDQRIGGYGISGGVGYFLPRGMFLSNFGNNARLEFGGSYVDASASQAASISGPGTTNASLPNLAGATLIATACGAGCTSTSNLKTSYSSWRASGAFLTDYRVNGITLTPSLRIFGGQSRNNQTLSNRATFAGSANFAQYDVSTKLDWTDWGGRVGLSGSAPVTDRMTFSIGGNIGLAARNVSLNGSDTSFLSLFPATINASAISLHQTTTPFLANAETSLAFKLAPNWLLRTFAGVDYDSKVPGIAAPGVVLGGGNSTPAGLNSQSLASYYVGGGLTAKF